MRQIKRIIYFLNSHSKLFKAILAFVIGISFVGSMVLAVFIGGELKSLAGTDDVVKGLLRIIEFKYETSYIVGDKFIFDKEKSKIMLLAKDPLIENIVNIDDLPGSEYGFSINGEGKIFDEASSITITEDVRSIAVVSKKYPSIKAIIEITVAKAPKQESLVTQLLCEAENAKLYQDNILLTNEDKATKPDTEKPFNSSKGLITDGELCSGGAVLRNFQSRNMKVEFEFISLETTQINLLIMCCKRPTSQVFGENYLVTVNGKTVPEIDSQVVPAGSGYFEQYSLEAVTINVVRGINRIVFESGAVVGKSNPVNLDAIKLIADNAILSGLDVVEQAK